jgi:peptidoglycan/xylan/chitin deacetylase (PgdA/CDA1 family)
MRKPGLTGQTQDRRRLGSWLVLTTVGALTLSLSGWVVHPDPAVAATASTVVTIGFDDGTAEQLDALPILQAHGMAATFFVNTAAIGDAEHLSWANLHTLSNAGNEIAGHTLHHVNLAPLTTAEARQEVCTDRNRLLDEGFPATSFAYPFGSFDNGTEQVVHDCGYNSGRGVAGISKTGPYAETIPPLDPYATRTPPNPKKATKLSTLELYVQNAEANGGGWVQFVFHRLCEQCGAYAITPAKFTALLDLSRGQSNGVMPILYSRSSDA